VSIAVFRTIHLASPYPLSKKPNVTLRRQSFKHRPAKTSSLFIVLFDLDHLVVGELGTSIHRRGAELTRHRGSQFLGVVTDDVIQTVVPPPEQLHEWGLLLVGVFAQLASEIENALNMIVVDMAQHEQVDLQRLVAPDPLFPDFLQPRPQMRTRSD
jgi:hypothetical protein